MSKEELIEKLQTVYVGDINALNEMIGYYDGLKQGIEELQQENKQLKEQLESSEKARKEAIKYLYEHSQYVDEYGIHYIKENEYCVDYLLDILNIDKGE